MTRGRWDPQQTGVSSHDHRQTHRLAMLRVRTAALLAPGIVARITQSCVLCGQIILLKPELGKNVQTFIHRLYRSICVIRGWIEKVQLLGREPQPHLAL